MFISLYSLFFMLVLVLAFYFYANTMIFYPKLIGYSFYLYIFALLNK